MELEDLLPEDGFVDGHVHALVGLLGDLSRFPNRKTSDRGVVLHVWLYHLCGGSNAKLVAPPESKTKETLALYRFADKRTANHKSKLQSLGSEARRPKASTAAVERYCNHRALATRRDLLDACILRLRPSEEQAAAAAAAAAAAGGGGDPTPSGANTEKEQHTAGLVAFAMGTHERSTGYASRDEPCAVRLLAADTDVLGLIADFVRGKRLRVLMPPPREVQVLRADVWREHKEKHAWRELAEERGLQLEAALGDAARAARREALALAEAAAIRKQFDEFSCQLQEDSTVWRAAVEREHQAALKAQSSAAAAAKREQKRELTGLWSAALERAERAEAETVRAKEDVEGDRREELRWSKRVRLEADAARAQVQQALDELESQHTAQLAAMERLRNARNGSALERQARALSLSLLPPPTVPFFPSMHTAEAGHHVRAKHSGKQVHGWVGGGQLIRSVCAHVCLV